MDTKLTPRSRRSIGATRRAATTFSADMANAAPNEAPEQHPDAAALAGLGLRTVVTGRAVGDRGARRLLSAVRGFEQRMRTHADRVERVRQRFDRPEFHARFAVLHEHAKRASRMGYVASYLPYGLVILIAICMVINDPVFVYSTMRENLDVPESTPIWDFSNTGVLISLAVAVGLSALLVGGAVIIGTQLGHLIFSGRLARDATRYLEVARSRKEFDVRRRWIVVITMVAVLGFFIWFLNRIAHTRFEGGLTAAFSGEQATLAATTIYLTVLPIVVVVLEVFASAPQAVHLRRIGKWALQARLSEFFGVRSDQRALSRLHRRRDAVERSELRLRDALEDTGIRAQGEVVRAAADHGRVDLAPVLALFTEGDPAEGPVGAGGAETAPSRIRAGSLLTPAVSSTVARAFAALDRLPEIPASSPIAAFWRELRALAELADEASTEPEVVPPAVAPARPAAQSAAEPAAESRPVAQEVQ